jgi:hypothetical protein
MSSRKILAVGFCLVVGCAPKTSPVPSDEVPVRCILRWGGPGEHCALPGNYRAEAVGLSEAEATQRARRRLAGAVRSGVRSRASMADERRRTGIAEKAAACAAVASQRGTVACFPEAVLATSRRCRVEFPVPGCNTERPVEVKGKPWTRGERARDELCADLALPAGLTLGATAECTSRCLQQTRLVCE